MTPLGQTRVTTKSHDSAGGITPSGSKHPSKDKTGIKTTAVSTTATSKSFTCTDTDAAVVTLPTVADSIETPDVEAETLAGAKYAFTDSGPRPTPDDVFKASSVSGSKTLHAGDDLAAPTSATHQSTSPHTEAAASIVEASKRTSDVNSSAIDGTPSVFSTSSTVATASPEATVDTPTPPSPIAEPGHLVDPSVVSSNVATGVIPQADTTGDPPKDTTDTPKPPSPNVELRQPVDPNIEFTSVSLKSLPTDNYDEMLEGCPEDPHTSDLPIYSVKDELSSKALRHAFNVGTIEGIIPYGMEAYDPKLHGEDTNLYRSAYALGYQHQDYSEPTTPKHFMDTLQVGYISKCHKAMGGPVMYLKVICAGFRPGLDGSPKVFLKQHAKGKLPPGSGRSSPITPQEFRAQMVVEVCPLPVNAGAKRDSLGTVTCHFVAPSGPELDAEAMGLTVDLTGAPDLDCLLYTSDAADE